MNTENAVTEKTLLSAEQAKELAITGRDNLLNTILSNIEYNAKKGANNFEYWTDIKGSEHDFTPEESKLKELGYTVDLKFSEANNEYKFLISW